MTSGTIAMLAMGIIFTVVAIAGFISYRGKRPKEYIVLGVGILIIYLTTIGPLSHSQEKINAVTHLDPGQLVSITLQPTRKAGYSDFSLVRSDRLIGDSSTLRRISRLLQQAIPGGGYIRRPTQFGRMEITLRNQPPLIIGFRKKGTATCIVINSNGEDGFGYGSLNAPGLGPLLDSLASGSR